MSTSTLLLPGPVKGEDRSLRRSVLAHLALFYPAYTCAAGIRGLGLEGVSTIGGEEKIIVSEAGATQEKARRVLQAAAVEAYGRPGAYVSRHRVMQRTNITDVEEFRAIAEYLDRRGWIAEGGDDYGYFVVTPAGIDEAMS